jgi:hypothetical protein
MMLGLTFTLRNGCILSNHKLRGMNKSYSRNPSHLQLPTTAYVLVDVVGLSALRV